MAVYTSSDQWALIRPACRHAHTACATGPCPPQWKGFCLDELEGKWDFQGNWQDTYLLGMQVKQGASSRCRRCCRYSVAATAATL